jgi:hypothetical protein
LENYKLGYMWGFVSRLSPKPLEIPPALAAILEPETIGALLHAEIAKASAPEASEFYAGLSDGLKRENFSPPAPYIIYLVLALAWPEVSVLKNMTQIHGWLEQHLGSNLTGSRDRIAKICQKIRLPLTDKGGRPKGKPRNRPTS